jgi:membrane protease YdiL (CAAX protease family)
LYRGIVLNALRGYRIIWRVLISSFFFSMVHLSYHVNGGYAVSSATISTMLSGICSAALRIVTGTLWAPIVMHALHNFLAFSRCTDSQLLVSRRGPVSLYGLVANIALALSLALYGFWILRRMRLSKCRGDQGRLNHPRTSMTG